MPTLSDLDRWMTETVKIVKARGRPVSYEELDKIIEEEVKAPKNVTITLKSLLTDMKFLVSTYTFTVAAEGDKLLQEDQKKTENREVEDTFFEAQINEAFAVVLSSEFASKDGSVSLDEKEIRTLKPEIQASFVRPHVDVHQTQLALRKHVERVLGNYIEKRNRERHEKLKKAIDSKLAKDDGPTYPRWP